MDGDAYPGPRGPDIRESLDAYRCYSKIAAITTTTITKIFIVEPGDIYRTYPIQQNSKTGEGSSNRLYIGAIWSPSEGYAIIRNAARQTALQARGTTLLDLVLGAYVSWYASLTLDVENL